MITAGRSQGGGQAVTVVDLDRKIKRLCDEAKLGVTQLPNDMNELTRIGIATIRSWIKQSEPTTLWGSGRKRFVTYWSTLKNLPFNDADLELPYDEFDAAFTARMNRRKEEEFHVHEKVKHLLGTYQILRPHTGSEHCYVLEPMSIEIDNARPTNMFYSHNHLGREYLYKGKSNTAERYYFSLMTRQHEHVKSMESYRCVAFNIGEGMWESCLSGLMLRGVTGEGAAKRAVAVPFLALRSGEKDSLVEPNWLLLDAAPGADRVYRLAPKSHVLIGEIRARWYPKLFAICDSIFKQIGDLKAGLFPTNRMVLNTLAPSNLRDIAELNFKDWARVVDSLPISPGPAAPR